MGTGAYCTLIMALVFDEMPPIDITTTLLPEGVPAGSVTLT